MFENKSSPLAHRHIFLRRLRSYFIFGTALMIFSLSLGTLGYYYFASMSWIDAFYNAAMILTGMGPTVTITNNAGKLFGSFYALYSGIVFLSSIAIVFAPILHRFFHVIHLENK